MKILVRGQNVVSLENENYDCSGRCALEPDWKKYKKIPEALETPSRFTQNAIP
jgi:hypothetical protein